MRGFEWEETEKILCVWRMEMELWGNGTDGGQKRQHKSRNSKMGAQIVNNYWCKSLEIQRVKIKIFLEFIWPVWISSHWPIDGIFGHKIKIGRSGKDIVD